MKLGRMSEKWEEADLNGATRTLFLLDDGGKEKKKKKKWERRNLDFSKTRSEIGSESLFD